MCLLTLGDNLGLFQLVFGSQPSHIFKPSGLCWNFLKYQIPTQFKIYSFFYCGLEEPFVREMKKFKWKSLKKPFLFFFFSFLFFFFNISHITSTRRKRPFKLCAHGELKSWREDLYLQSFSAGGAWRSTLLVWWVFFILAFIDAPFKPHYLHYLAFAMSCTCR